MTSIKGNQIAPLEMNLFQGHPKFSKQLFYFQWIHFPSQTSFWMSLKKKKKYKGGKKSIKCFLYVLHRLQLLHIKILAYTKRVEFIFLIYFSLLCVYLFFEMRKKSGWTAL